MTTKTQANDFSTNPSDYEFIKIIGYGSSAIVHSAIYKPTNQKVAVKLIDMEMFERNQIDELRVTKPTLLLIL
jgi:serine/threonine protein kinase